MFLCPLVLLLALQPVSGSIELLVKPKDTVAMRRDTVTLECAPNFPMEVVDWAYYPDGQEDYANGAHQIVEGCVVSGILTWLRYSVTRDVNYCDLNIRRATTAVTGTYECVANDTARANGSLTILDSVPNGIQYPSNVVEGDVVTMSCGVAFQGPLTPELLWTPAGDNVGLSMNTETGVFSSIEIQVPAGPAVIEPRTCSLYFPPTTVYTPYNWTSEAVIVQHCPLNMTAWPDGDITPVTLYCLAEAYPQPEYYWIDLTTNTTLSNQSQLTLTTAGHYKLMCTAYNDITYSNGTVLSCSNFTIVSGDVSGTGSDWWVYAVAFGVLGACLLVTIVILVYCFCHPKGRWYHHSSRQNIASITRKDYSEHTNRDSTSTQISG